MSIKKTSFISSLIIILLFITFFSIKDIYSVEETGDLELKVAYLEKELVRTRRTATGGLVLGGLSAILSLIAISRIK